jgi:hypothetical protein
MIELEADAILGCTLIDESTLDAAPAVKGR